MVELGYVGGFGLILAILIGFRLYIYYKKKRHNKSHSIAIIRGADGPTSISISHSMKKEIQEDKLNQWDQLLQTCKEITVPRAYRISGEEIKQYIINEYDAKEIVLSPHSKRSLKHNVILNHYPEALEDLKLSQDNKEFGHFEQFKNIELIPDEKYNLEFSAFIIPRTSKTEVYYQENEQERNEYINETRSLFSRVLKRPPTKTFEDVEEMKFEMELSTGYMTLSNGGRRIMAEIVLWKGITQEDIDNCTPVFMEYVAAMRDRGKVRYNEKEGKWVERIL